jgi:biotin--protein ligase
MSTQALVYADKGVCLPSADALVEQLRSLLDPSVSVFKVGAHYLRTESWEDKTSVLAMGGGSCSFWDEQLQIEGMEKIHQYVLGGGKYIGLCAGAYFASAESCFELSDLSIKKNRSLGFFPGRALGPLVESDDYLSLCAARAAEVCFKIRNSSVIGSLYYQGGCLFDIEADLSNVEVTSTYCSLGKAASVFCKVGKGCAFLDGTHPEFQWAANLTCRSESFYSELVTKLVPQEVFRQKIWEEIGTKLELPMRFNSNHTINVKI